MPQLIARTSLTPAAAMQRIIQRAFAQAVEKQAPLFARGLRARLVGFGEFAQQVFLGVRRERAAVVLDLAGFRVAVDHVQQFQWRDQTLRGPGGVVGHVVGIGGLVHTGENFVVGGHVVLAFSDR